MRRFRNIAAASVLSGLAVAFAIAALQSAAERYLDHGLEQLSFGVLRAALVTYVPVALAGAAAAMLLEWLARRPHARPVVASAIDLLVWQAAVLPPIAWAAAQEPALLARSSLPLFGLLGVLAVALAAARMAVCRLPRLAAATSWIGQSAAVLLAAAAVLSALQPLIRKGPAAQAERPNILLIVLDTVRADRLSAYGYERATTPEIDAFARQAIRFDDFHSTSSWTVPSHASLFTGLYPRAHGATQERMRLDPGFATLAEILRNAGYETWAASGNPWLGRGVNLTQGFEHYVETWRYDLSVGHQHPPGTPHPANQAFERFVRGADPDRPFFAFVNFMDAHMPYTPPEPYLSRFLPEGKVADDAYRLARHKWTHYYRGRPYDEDDLALLSDMYDGGIAYVSAAVGRLLQILRERELEDETLVLITADHGELFGESGRFAQTGLLGHMFGLYNATVRVPLLIRMPGGERAGDVDRRKGQLLDLFPTLLIAAGVDASEFDHSGVDLLADDGEEVRESIFSEYYFPRFTLAQFTPEELEAQAEVIAPFRRRLRAIQRYGFRLIWSSDGRHELFDLRSDPNETTNLLLPEHRTPVANEFLEMLEAELIAYAPDSRVEEISAQGEDAPLAPTIDDASLEALKAVGYVR